MMIIFLFLIYGSKFIYSEYLAFQFRVQIPRKYLLKFKCENFTKIDPFYICGIDTSSTSIRDLYLRASSYPAVLKVIQGRRDMRSSRFFLNDPDLKEQQLYIGPYFHPSKDVTKYSHNLLPLWEKGINGKGVVITVVDDGIDATHPEIVDNFDSQASFNYLTNDPSPQTYTEFHGTKCAGLIASKANNSLCGAGASHGVRLGAIRIMDAAVGEVLDINEALAFNHRLNYISIYSMSWGPLDDGIKRARPSELVSRALEIGALTGRNGLGAIYLFASGNGGSRFDHCHADGYLQEYSVTTIGSMTSSGKMPPYGERCSAIIASTLSNADRRPENKIYTIQPSSQCGRFHTGTSVSAPIAASLFALLLQVKPNLSRRDIEDLIIKTAIQTDPQAIVNGANLKYSLNFGFGLMDIHKMIEIATDSSFKPKSPMFICRTPYFPVNFYLDKGGTIHSSIYTSGCLGSPNAINIIEVLIITLSLKTAKMSSLSGYLTSPLGTRMPILESRLSDHSPDGLDNWDVKVMGLYHEYPFGIYTLELIAEQPNFIHLVKWGLTMYGFNDERVNASQFHHQMLFNICTQINIQNNQNIQKMCDLSSETYLINKRDFDELSFHDSSFLFGKPLDSHSTHKNYAFFYIIIFLVSLAIIYFIFKMFSSYRDLSFSYKKIPFLIPTNDL